MARFSGKTWEYRDDGRPVGEFTPVQYTDETGRDVTPLLAALPPDAKPFMGELGDLPELEPHLIHRGKVRNVYATEPVHPPVEAPAEDRQLPLPS